MALCDIHGKPIAGSGTVTSAKPIYSAPDRIVVQNAVLSANAVTAHETVNIVEYMFSAGSVFWLGETQSGVSTYWLYPNQIDFTVGTTPPSGNIVQRSYYGLIFLKGCAAYGGEYIHAVESEGFVFTALKDLYLYVPDTVVIVRDPTDDFLSAFAGQGNSVGTAESGFLLWDDGYTTGFTRQTTADHLKIERPDVADAKHYRAVKRTPDDGELYLHFIGDSIIEANSVGVAHAYRTIVPGHFNAPNGYLAKGGAAVTSGYGFAWDEGGAAGYAGLSAKLDAMNGYRCSQYDVVVFAMGTNDWGNDAPLGTIDDTDDTTFYGALKLTYDKLMERFPNAAFIVMIPFKRENWNAQNEAGHYLLEYCRAIYEVLNLRKYRRFYILDLFDKWFLDWDNEVMRRQYFVDYVHPNKTAHICIARALEEKITEVMAIEGIKKIVPAD